MPNPSTCRGDPAPSASTAAQTSSAARRKSRTTPATVSAVSASIRCWLIDPPVAPTRIAIQPERTPDGTSSANLWRLVLLRSLRHRQERWRSERARPSPRACWPRHASWSIRPTRRLSAAKALQDQLGIRPGQVETRPGPGRTADPVLRQAHGRLQVPHGGPCSLHGSLCATPLSSSGTRLTKEFRYLLDMINIVVWVGWFRVAGPSGRAVR